MDTPATAFFELAPRVARRMDFADGRELVVLRGRVWVTCTDHSEEAGPMDPEGLDGVGNG